MPLDKVLSEGEKEDLYKEYLLIFRKADTWRDYLTLAEKFKSLGVYKESADYILKCVNAASASCYREITEGVSNGEIRTVGELGRAADYMEIISSYKDARELARNYRTKARALAYVEVMEIVENSESGADDWERAVNLLAGMKSYKDSRDLYDRYYGHYVQMRYAEAELLMKNAGTHFEYISAAQMFEKISEYSDSAKMAQKCRKAAEKYKPEKASSKVSGKKKPTFTEKTAAVKNRISKRTRIGTNTKPLTKIKAGRSQDQVRILKELNKKYLFSGIVFLILCAAGLYGSVVISPSNTSLPDFIHSRAEIFRGICVASAVIFAVLSIKSFLRLMTVEVRKRLLEKLVLAAKKFVSPVAKIVNKVLAAMGIGVFKGRVRGKDEKSFVYASSEKTRRKKAALKNTGKWDELEDNAMRVRYIFTDYMIKKIKGGYFMRHSMTSDEIGREIAENDDEKLLFEVYRKARYAGRLSLDEIDNNLVSELQETERQKKNN